jgi:biopolymer transport protein ExbD
MKFKRHHIELEKGQLDIAPLVDVVLLLLIFFMLTSSYIFQPGIKIHLPHAVTSKVIEEKSLIITVTAENLIYLNKDLVTLKQLAQVLSGNEEKTVPLLIKADRRCSLGRIVEVWDVCRESGFQQINIATDRDVP